MAARSHAVFAPSIPATPEDATRTGGATGASAWSAWRGLVFGLLCIEIATALGGGAVLLGLDRVQGAAAVVLLMAGHVFGGAIAGPELTFAGFGGALAIAPLVGVLILGVSAVTAHLLVIILARRRSAGFGKTFTVISLASVVHLVNWLPAIGLPLNLLGMVLAMLGLRRVHKLDAFRAALIGFAPALALLAYAALILFAPE